MRRGRKPLGNDVELRTTVTAEIAAALDLLVELGGFSKATLVRWALIDQLTLLGALYPGVAATLTPTKPAGASATTQKGPTHD